MVVGLPSKSILCCDDLKDSDGYDDMRAAQEDGMLYGKFDTGVARAFLILLASPG